MIDVAYLRVYLPADTVATRPEHRFRLNPELRASQYGVWQESLDDDAFTVDWEGKSFSCPRYAKLRMLEGLLAFHNAYPGLVGPTLVPEDVVRRAASELQRLYDSDPGARSHILASPWHVPLRWFAAFTPDQREFLDGPGGSTIRYRTTRSSASERLQRAISVLDDAGFDEAVVDPVRHLTEWLDEFPGEAMLELDYGTVAGLFNDGQLAFDETAADIAASLDALEAGDFDSASEHYVSAATRWAPAQARLYAN